MAEHNIPYFRDLWQRNMSDLENYCEEWEKICNDYQIPDEVHGEIRTAIGLSRLLMNQKLKQFKGLIDDSEFSTGEKEITCMDLEGFWDMVYNEVEKIQKSFERLKQCKNNDWKFVEEISEKHIKKAPVKKDIAAINKKKEISKAQVLAARHRIAELKKKMAADRKNNEDLNKVDILLPNKKELTENNEYGDVMNTVILNDKTLAKESVEKSKPKYQTPSKKISVDTNDFKASPELNSATKQKSAQKKKHAISNKENVFLDDSSDLKRIPTKQAKFNEPDIQESEKIRNKPNFVKLQCVTRSAAKKALLLQENLMKN